MNIKVFQFKVIDGEVARNIAKVNDLFEGNDLVDTDIVVLPEMWTSGYDLENIEQYAAEDLEPVLTEMKKLATTYDVNIVAGSIPNTKGTSAVYNTAFVIDRHGQLVYEYSKMHLVPMLNEPEFLASGNDSAEVFELEGQSMGALICYDLRFPEVFRDLALLGAKVIFVVAEWPIERSDHWVTLLKARAIENQCYIVVSNTIGSQSNGSTFAGKSLIIDPFGKVMAEGSENQEEILSETLNLSYIDQIREDIPIFKSRRKELYKHL